MKLRNIPFSPPDMTEADIKDFEKYQNMDQGTLIR